MPAQLDENIQYEGADGLPLVGGLIYIGTVGLEPIGNLITIYSDEDLTIAIANPQTIGAEGRSGTKIYIPGKYSLRVNTVLGAQNLLDLNVGSSADTGTTSLTSVLGTNAITAQGEAAVVTELIDKEVYTLKIANTNTGTSGVTLEIDSTPVTSIVKNFDQPIDPGDFTQNQIIRVAYNSTEDNLAWVDASVKTKRSTQGSNIASASSITIPNNDGYLFDITGNVTIVTINGVPGTFNTFQTLGTPTFTDSSGLSMLGGVDFTAEAGDWFTFYQLTASTVVNTNIAKVNGFSVGRNIVEDSITTTSTIDGSSGTNKIPVDGTVPQNTEGVQKLTKAIVTKSASNRLRITVKADATLDGAGSFSMAVFQDSVADAILSTMSTPSSSVGTITQPLVIDKIVSAAVLGSTTLNVRFGPSNNTIMTINGATGATIHGASMFASLIVEEIPPA